MKSLNQFVLEELQRVARFEAWWQEQHEIDPDAFPMSLEDGNEGPWHEQLATFEDQPPKEWDSASLAAAGYVVGARVRYKADPAHPNVRIISLQPDGKLYLKVQGGSAINSTANDFEVMP